MTTLENSDNQGATEVQPAEQFQPAQNTIDTKKALQQINKRRRGADLPPATQKVVKRAWHTAVSDKKTKLSLKKFARSLSIPEAQEWFDNKRGAQEKQGKKSRLENRGGTIRMIAQATKSSRRGGKSS